MRIAVLSILLAACGRENFDPAYNLAFITSTVHLPTDFGSDQSGADAICAARADEAGLPGPFVALLATKQATAINRLGNARGWIRPDGLPLADRSTDVAEGNVFYPLRVDENGEDLGAGDARFAIGNVEVNSQSGECGDYSDPAASLTVVRADTTGPAWKATLFSQIACSTSVHVACFGVGFDVPLEFVPAGGRRAFVSTQDFTPGGGIAAADALCAQEAQLASLGGQFLALLPTANASAISRFDLERPVWERVDGVALATSTLAFVAADLQASFHLTALGTLAREGVTTGALPGDTPGDSAGTCTDWTAQGGVLLGSSSRSGTATFSVASSGSCSNPIYCLEE